MLAIDRFRFRFSGGAAGVALTLLAARGAAQTAPDVVATPSSTPPETPLETRETPSHAPAVAGPSSTEAVTPGAAETATDAVPLAPADPAAYPPIGGKAEARRRGLEAHGYLAAWWLPWSQPSPTQAKDPFRLRFAVLRGDASLSKTVSVLARVGFMQPGSPLLDLDGTWSPHAAFAVTVGQFRLPIGASATTLAPNIVMLDRPNFVYAMTKLAFRDTGVMLHSKPEGIGGIFHYRLVAASGAGRFGAGGERPPGAVENALFAGRVLADVGPRLLGPKGRLAVGVSYVHSHDPAISTGNLATDKDVAANTLGRSLAPFAKERESQLLGADFTFSHRGVWLQAETLYLKARAIDGSLRRSAIGASLEAAYLLGIHPGGIEGVQFAARAEHFDPNMDVRNDEQQTFSLGGNALLTRNVRASVFGSEILFRDAKTGEKKHGGELAFRAAYLF
jgi:hypothetical protein